MAGAAGDQPATSGRRRDPARTFDPPRRLVLARAAVETCRLLPLLLATVFAELVVIGLEAVAATYGVGWAVVVSAGVLLGPAGGGAHQHT